MRAAILGKKGELTAVLKGMKDVAPEDRPKVGQWVNETREACLLYTSVFLLWKIICYDVLSKLDSDTIIIQYFYMLGGISVSYTHLDVYKRQS